MRNVDRRTFLALGGAAGLAGALGLAGCGRSGPARDVAGTITWWDQFQPLEALQRETFDAVAGRLGVTVDYTVYDPAGLGQALQLAQQSGRVPDVFTNGYGVPELVLVENDWVRPIELSPEARARFPEGTLVEGLHTFGGELYSFPLFTPHQHATLTWFDQRAVEAAGGDPERGPRTWDEFRSLAGALTSAGSSSGWIEGLALLDRLRQHVIDLATGAGAVLSFSGNGADAPGVADARTGEYPFDSAEFLDVFEFLGSLVRDGVMFPSSTSLDVRTARARWVGGSAGLFFDGPWNVGVLAGQFPDALATLGLADMPTPDGVARAMNGPVGGSFWLSRTSSDAAAASEILSRMTTADYARGLAAAMDQPPADVAAVAEADVPDAYARAVSLMRDSVRLAPSPVAKNPAVGSVLSEMKQIRPNLGEIAQGYLGGNVDDVGAELTRYRSRLATERDRAIEVVRAGGQEVSLDDWIFDESADQTTGSPRS